MYRRYRYLIIFSSWTATSCHQWWQSGGQPSSSCERFPSRQSSPANIFAILKGLSRHSCAQQKKGISNAIWMEQHFKGNISCHSDSEKMWREYLRRFEFIKNLKEISQAIRTDKNFTGTISCDSNWAKFNRDYLMGFEFSKILKNYSIPCDSDSADCLDPDPEHCLKDRWRY